MPQPVGMLVESSSSSTLRSAFSGLGEKAREVEDVEGCTGEDESHMERTMSILV